MFSFSPNKYVSKQLKQSSTPYHNTSKTSVSLCAWLIILFPQIPVEKLYPLALLHLRTTRGVDSLKLHPTVELNPDYVHFKHTCLRALQTHGLHALQMLAYVMPKYARFECSLPERTSLKVVQTLNVPLHNACETLCQQDLYIHASILHEFADKHPITHVIVFHNTDRTQILKSLLGFQEQSEGTFSSAHYIIGPYTIVGPQQACFLAISPQYQSIVRHFIFCNLVLNTCSIKKNILFLAPFIVTGFLQHSTSIFYTIKVLLRWLCISRNQQRGILSPGQPGFELYSYLPNLLNLFEVRNVFGTPNFLRGLKAFLQLQKPHFCSSLCVDSIYNYLSSSGTLQQTFPQVWDIVTHWTTRSDLKNDLINEIPLNDIFCIGDKNFPAFLFFYGLALSDQVPVKIRQLVWLDLRILGECAQPGKLKGIEQYQRNLHIYKNYNTTCLINTNTTSPQAEAETEAEAASSSSSFNIASQQLLNLAMLLEYRIIHTSKSAFNINSVPLIDMQPFNTNFPLLCNDRSDSSSLVYSNSLWVVRNIHCLDSTITRRFLKDETALEILYSYNVLNSI